ncbi:MAG: hypothetical protein WBV43_11530, partial [Pseudolabrys sp.]
FWHLNVRFRGADIASAAQDGLVQNSTSARGSNAFHLAGAALGVRVLAARALEGELIIGIALVDVDDPERHPAMGAERAPVRRLKR